MCFRIQRCCCFSNTKDGSFATGVYTLILSLLSLIACAVIIALFETIIKDAKDQGDFAGLNPSSIRINSIIYLVWAVLHIFISAFLLYGIKNDNRLFLIPWLIWMAIVIVFQVVIFILFFIAMFTNCITAAYLVLTGLFAVFHIYCYSCVYSQYKTLYEETYARKNMPEEV